jgi:hypothetical protein
MEDVPLFRPSKRPRTGLRKPRNDEDDAGETVGKVIPIKARRGVGFSVERQEDDVAPADEDSDTAVKNFVPPQGAKVVSDAEVDRHMCVHLRPSTNLRLY